MMKNSNRRSQSLSMYHENTANLRNGSLDGRAHTLFLENCESVEGIFRCKSLSYTRDAQREENIKNHQCSILPQVYFVHFSFGTELTKIDSHGTSMPMRIVVSLIENRHRGSSLPMLSKLHAFLLLQYNS